METTLTLLVVTSLLGCLAPPPPAVPVPIASPPGTQRAPRQHSIARAKLDTRDTPIAFPLHGVVLHSWGLGGDAIVAVDLDAGSVHVVSHPVESPPMDKTVRGDPRALQALGALADAAWREKPKGPMPSATDIREDLFVVDGGTAFYLSGTPISEGEGTGRPAAGDVIDAVGRLEEAAN